MKKFLLGTTAIVGLAALAVSSASAAEAPKLTISGFAIFEATIVDEDNHYYGSAPSVGNTTSTATRGHYFSMNEIEIHFNAKGKADNGLEYGARYEYEAEYNRGDEASVWFQGNWGWMELGSNDGAEDIVKLGGQTVLGGASAWDGENSTTAAKFNFYPGAARVAGTYDGYLINPDLGAVDTSDAMKITYFTPKFAGFRAGVSYVPQSNFASPGSGIYEDDPTSQDNVAGQVNDVWSFGAEYSTTVSDVSIALSARGGFADAQVPGTWEDSEAWGVGAVFGYAGFSLGGGYRDLGDSNITKANKAAGADAGKSWDVAVGYGFGPYKVAVGYFNSKVKSNVGGAVRELETDWVAVTADYAVAPGLGVYVEYDYIDMDDGTAGTAFDNEANQIIIGTKVTF